MKKILITVGGFPPAKKFGGPAVSIVNLCRLMQEQYDLVVITSDHDLDSRERLPGIETGKTAQNGYSVYYLPDEEKNYRRLKQIADEERPDLIYLNSLFSHRYLIPLLRYAKKTGVPILLAPRGELCENAMRKRMKKNIYIGTLRLLLRLSRVSVHMTAENERDGVKKWLGTADENIYIARNIPTVYSKKKPDGEKQPGVCRGVFISRIHPKKNLTFGLECLKNVTGRFSLDIYGPPEDKAYWKQCEQIIGQLPENITVTYRGLVDHEDVCDTFAGYDLFFFPTKSENYGHVIAESLLAGCPVVTSDQVPWCDMQDYGCGYALPLDQPESFTRAIDRFCRMDGQTYRKAVDACAVYTEKKLDYAALREEYRAMFEASMKQE